MLVHDRIEAPTNLASKGERKTMATSGGVGTADKGSLLSTDWDALAASAGRVELPGGISVVPQTPLIGANVLGLNLAGEVTTSNLEAVTSALLRYKVLMIRSGGAWRMDVDQHTRFCQQLSRHWGITPDTEQKKSNNSEGLSVHPFLPWQRGSPHVWPTSAVTGGGKQYLLRDSEDVENFEPFAANKRPRRTHKETLDQGTTRGGPAPLPLKPYRPGTFGAAAMAQDAVSNGANGFHFDDGFFHQPPSAVVLNALVLPKVGGDTIFADMGAAYRGLAPELQAWAQGLTQTMDWRHVFPIWEAEAERRLQADGDPSFAQHVEVLKRDYPPSLQPVVRQHPVTGELSIYTNQGFTHHINDVSPEESRQLMALLGRMAERPEYQVRFRWNDPGDVCIYDNRITNHYAVADYGEVGPRALHHIALLGEPTRNAQGQAIG
jgi:alpha-ketoglutarate-dependent taurine dioxygenase